jgi:hypothetical protein
MKVKNASLPLLTLLLSTLVLAVVGPIPTSAAQYQYAKPPGMPSNAIQYNRTDITPYRRMEQLVGNNTYVFAYRNVTMMMNCSHTSTMNITIDSQVQTRTLALHMLQNQSALFTMQVAASPPPGVQTMHRTLNLYWGIEPNATLQLQVQLRLYINATTLNAEMNRAVNMSRLSWMYWNGSRNCWVTVDSHIDENGYLVCETSHLSTWTVAETVPGMPENANHYDRSDITPNQQMEQLVGNNTYVFAYRNVTMMMNCSQTTVMNLTVGAQVRTRTFAVNMLQDQPIQLDMTIATAPPAGVQTMTRTLNVYWDIEPNATLQLRAQLRVHIDGVALASELGRVVNASRLTWMHWNTTRNGWDAVDSWIDADGYLTCETRHLSTWTVAELEPAVQPQTPWLTYALVGGLLAAVAAFALYLVKRR